MHVFHTNKNPCSGPVVGLPHIDRSLICSAYHRNHPILLVTIYHRTLTSLDLENIHSSRSAPCHHPYHQTTNQNTAIVSRGWRWPENEAKYENNGAPGGRGSHSIKCPIQTAFVFCHNNSFSQSLPFRCFPTLLNTPSRTRAPERRMLTGHSPNTELHQHPHLSLHKKWNINLCIYYWSKYKNQPFIARCHINIYWSLVWHFRKMFLDQPSFLITST